jgi:hypothetical protein
MVKISCAVCGRHEVPARFSAGGLAVTPYHGFGCESSDRLFVVTHVRSGLKLGTGAVSFNRAKRALMRLLEVTDWTRKTIEDEALHNKGAWVKKAKAIVHSLLSDDEPI